MFIFLTLSLLSRRWILGYLHTIPDEKLSVIVWTATTRARLSHTLNFKPAQLAERVWCTQVLSSLLNNYFRLFSSQALSFLFYFRNGSNRCSYYTKVWLKPCPICDTPLSRLAQRSFVVRHRNRAATIVFVCEQKPYSARVSWRRKSYLVLYEHSIKFPIDVVDVNYQNCWYTGMRYWKLPRGFTIAQPFWQRFTYCLGDWNRPKRTMRAKQKTKRIVTHHTFFRLSCPYLLIPLRWDQTDY